MDFFEILKKRRACHHFLPNKIMTDAECKTLIKYTSFTPSGYNAQPWEFVFIRHKKRLEELVPIAFNQKHIVNAAAVVVVLGDLKIVRDPKRLLKDWVKYGYCTEEEVPAYTNTFTKPRKYERLFSMALRNGTLAAMTLIYAAEAMGFATCPMMGLSQYQLMDFIDAPEDRIPIMMVAIGYEDEGKEKEQLPRKPVEEVMYGERFGEMF